MEAQVIGRLIELFEGPEAAPAVPWGARGRPAPGAPPAMPAALHALLPWRAFDEGSELYVNAGSIGFILEIPPFAGIDEETLGALAGTLADAAPERCTVQAIHWTSPRFGAALEAWAEPRRRAGGALGVMGTRRARLLEHAGWRGVPTGRAGGRPPRAARPSRSPTIGRSSAPRSPGLPAPPRRPSSGRSAGRSKARSRPPGPPRGGSSPTHCSRWLRSWWRPTPAARMTAVSTARAGAGRHATR